MVFEIIKENKKEVTASQLQIAIKVLYELDKRIKKLSTNNEDKTKIAYNLRFSTNGACTYRIYKFIKIFKKN